MEKWQAAGDHTIWQRCRYKHPPGYIQSPTHPHPHSLTHHTTTHPCVTYFLESVSESVRECVTERVCWCVVGSLSGATSNVLRCCCDYCECEHVCTDTIWAYWKACMHACTHVYTRTHMFDAELLQPDEWTTRWVESVAATQCIQIKNSACHEQNDLYTNRCVWLFAQTQECYQQVCYRWYWLNRKCIIPDLFSLTTRRKPYTHTHTW